MSQVRACLIAAVLVAFHTATLADDPPASPPSAKAEEPKPGPDAEHARLAAMCGDWDATIAFWFKPGGKPVISKASSAIRPLFNGLFIEEKVEGKLLGAPFTTLAWTGFDPSAHQYQATRISSTTPGRIAESGTYNEASQQLELQADYAMGNDTWHQRTVIQQTSADAMIATSYLSFGNVPEWKGVEIKYTRRK